MDADSTTIPSAATTPDHISTIGTLKRLGETVLSTLHNRLELLSLELKEEKYWLVRTLLFASFALVFGLLSIVAILVTVAFLTPAEARPWVLLGLCAVCVGAAAYFSIGLQKKLERPAPLKDTLDQIKKDIECLKT
ncbi:MAG TPA: phage holin family protein [Candidatus Acidoferrum sp.]|nr:phage holin family protein [Candidatus Acidoferrum sp.]